MQKPGRYFGTAWFAQPSKREELRCAWSAQRSASLLPSKRRRNRDHENVTFNRKVELDGWLVGVMWEITSLLLYPLTRYSLTRLPAAGRQKMSKGDARTREPVSLELTTFGGIATCDICVDVSHERIIILINSEQWHCRGPLDTLNTCHQHITHATASIRLVAVYLDRVPDLCLYHHD